MAIWVIVLLVLVAILVIAALIVRKCRCKRDEEREFERNLYH
jgi:hypothetical protein